VYDLCRWEFVRAAVSLMVNGAVCSELKLSAWYQDKDWLSSIQLKQMRSPKQVIHGPSVHGCMCFKWRCVCNCSNIKIGSRFCRVLMMVYNTHRINGFLDFVHHPDSKGLEDKNDVSETGSVSVLRWGETPSLLGPLERANLNHWTTHVRRTKLFEHLRPGWVNES
jgi:hypothetical protein